MCVYNTHVSLEGQHECCLQNAVSLYRHQPEEIINTSIANGWQGLFEPQKTDRTQQAKCPSCLTEKLSQLQQAEAEQEKQRKRRKIKTLMNNLNLPERFADVTLGNYEPVNPDAARCLKLCHAYATHWPERLKRGGVVW